VTANNSKSQNLPTFINMTQILVLDEQLL